MKLKKFLSTAVDCIRGMEVSDEVFLNELEPNQLCCNLEELTGALNERGYRLPESENRKKVPITVEVCNETGKGMVAQVKFYPLPEGMNQNNFSFNTGDLTFYRSYTNTEGKTSEEVPAGRYLVEVSKGSEYEILTKEIIALEEEPACHRFYIRRFINLSEEGWYAGDLHHHSVYSSRLHGGTDPVVESPEEVAHSMQAMGLTFGALSDHHNVKNHGEWRKQETADFTPIISKEISTSNGHVLSLGVEEDIIYRIPKEEERAEEYLREEFYSITNRIKELSGLPQLNHPRDRQKAISWNPKFHDMINIFETIEIWNGSNPMVPGSTNWEAYGLWKELLTEGRFIPATTGSDTHNIKADDYVEYFRQITWLVGIVRDYRGEFCKELLKKADPLILLYDKVMPILEKWAKTTLTSGCVRTYTKVNGTRTSKYLLASLKKGHSFLTNGPILLPTIEGKGPGETVHKEEKELEVLIRLLANRPLKRLIIHQSGGRTETIVLENINQIKGFYDYSRVVTIQVQDKDWVYFEAYEDCTNLAITNPIFIA
ncbi:hypothetical protein acsn021_43320 [Anaerocolumna cellulosilytica]|uniref:Uncharacterized protein n=1 Tax=Anaerocolumna cellulosilytica TaxID=433286 RepID=A0A6S6R014_9FIRM|nr:CehA/McbA family metallohydrolase [Anaerocolumna cellulosilytica]MBB5195290.1 hypothetical protein [Anaerocolumna cellulosilytica]BCJ96763.1 hypothetical protein acsn021_43320 [Anaerocolumna cellulosilytica]